MKRIITGISLAVLMSVPVYAQYGHDDQRRNDRQRNDRQTVQSERMTGTVVSVNHRLNYITIRNDQTRRNVKIDVRQMDTRHSDFWRVRRGDNVSVLGAWANRDTFTANTFEPVRHSRNQ